MFNAFANDIAQTFNTPQPIEYGGTGGVTSIGGHDALVTRGGDVASASTVNLDSASGSFIDITGTTTIASVTLGNGKRRLARSVSGFTITVSANLVGNAGQNAIVAAGDLLIFEGYGSGVVRFWVLRSELASSDPWELQPIGVPIPLMTSLAGVTPPPTNKNYRYVKLDAADPYNSGVLTGESVTGSAPLVQATAVVNLVGSPVNGQTIRLINTERRVLRAGTAGAVENDQMQQITGSTVGGWIWGARGTGGSGALIAIDSTISNRASSTGGLVSMDLNFDSAMSPGARVGNETRPKNIGVTYYMRIK